MHEENWLDANGEKIFYRKSGSGPCVVFIHGFAEDGNIWDKQVNHLQEYFLLIVPDLPGSGKSALGHQSSAIGQHLSMDGYADIIRQILVKEEIATCTMIGHSMGGYITG